MKNRSKTILTLVIAVGVIVVLCLVALIDTGQNNLPIQNAAMHYQGETE
jgi:preprotein translocase subunit SecY